MELEAIGLDILDRLESGERLTKEQENIIMAHIRSGDLYDASGIVSKLRENSQHLQQKSVEEMAKIIDSLSKLMFYDVNNSIEIAIVCEWSASFTNAQANRIENEAARQEAAEKAVQIAQYAKQEVGKAAAAAQHTTVVQVPPPPPVGQAAQQGAQMALNPPPPFKGSFLR